MKTYTFLTDNSLLQADGTVPTLSIEKTDGAQIFLTEKSLNTQIITAKSSEMNLCITDKEGDLVSSSLVNLCFLQLVDKW